MDVNALTAQLLAEATQLAPQPATILDDIWKTESRNEVFGQELHIGLSAIEMNRLKLQSAMFALKENTRLLGPVTTRDALRLEIAQGLVDEVSLRALNDRCQTMLELSMSLFWRNWGDAIEEFLLAEKALRILREALGGDMETDSDDEEGDEEDPEVKADKEIRAEMRRVMEDIESAVPALRIFKRVLRRYEKQQNPDEDIPRITFEHADTLDPHTVYLHDWERMFEEGVGIMDEEDVRKWVEVLRPRG